MNYSIFVVNQSAQKYYNEIEFPYKTAQLESTIFLVSKCMWVYAWELIGYDLQA